jgi:TRAP-type mannitol/chloroaromatic compound transport system substrate-binding protein
MKRRDFIKAAAVGGTAAVAAPAIAQGKQEWKMVTTWPKDFPGLGTGANRLARYIGDITDGKISVKVYGGGELVPPFESFDAVSKGTAEIGHGAAYYWKAKTEAAQFFASVPFGLNGNEMNAWVYYGGGQKLWDEIYADFNLKPFLAGNTGVQMGGWFNKEINSIEDFKGLVMRMPGLGGQVIQEVGATPKLLPGGEIFTSLQTGAIDATEWVGPYNDLAFGFYKVAKLYYTPGWHEPGTALETFVNREVYESLPPRLREAIAIAAQAANNDMYAEFNARNGEALQTLVEEHGVIVKTFSPSVLRALKTVSEDLTASLANKDPSIKKVYDSFIDFRSKVSRWTDFSEVAYATAR